jgi:hypothetical protein
MTTQIDTLGKPAPNSVFPLDRGLLALRREIATYRRELPRLLAEGQEGRYVLIKDDQLISISDTFDDACQAGHERYGLGPFLAQPIDPRDLTRVFPEALESRNHPFSPTIP